MTSPVSVPDQSLITRRSILISAAASLICAPAIIRVTSLMPVRRLPFPFGPQYAGFVERLYLNALERGLQAALRAGRPNVEISEQNILIKDVRRQVAHARAHGFLPPYIAFTASS
jgi:hypothetical protein